MKRLEIGKEVLRKTTKCEMEFACLSGDDKCLFNVEHTIQDSVFYVTCEEEDCPYRVSHGFMGAVCSCPARVEIYKRHGK
jgi:hypothetical protein